MKIFETVVDLRAHLDTQPSNFSLGFVPTMGALHEGHLALIRKSMEENEISICSIFVNPTQFNNTGDLVNYPRTIDADISKLESIDCDILFLPSVEEVYPVYPPEIFSPDLGDMLLVMEGKHRPGHFNGVMTVVRRLFEILRPHISYFGEKDFQQYRVIQEMNKMLGMGILVTPLPTIRESNGLALSSRNLRLSPEEKELALNIPITLFRLQDNVKRDPERMDEFLKEAADFLNMISNGNLEYLEIVNEKNLQQEPKWREDVPLRLCVALQIGKIRLIDNIKL